MLLSSLGSARAIAVLTEGAVNPLPVRPWVYGATAFTVFMVLLAVTWAFRSVGHKH